MRTRVSIAEIALPSKPISHHTCNSSATVQCTECNLSCIEARDDHCSALVPSYHNKHATNTSHSCNGKIITFGGMCSHSFKVFGDLVEYNFNENSCGSIEHSGKCPSPRYKASCAYDELRNICTFS